MTSVRKAEAPSSGCYSWARRVEHLLLAIGCVLLLVFIAARIHAVVMYRAALWSFERLTEDSPIAQQGPGQATPGVVDFSGWSGQRVIVYTKALALKSNAPLAVLSIRRLRLNVPVFDGTDHLTLNRGVGRIIGTAGLGKQGNSGIAGHRDGFFRRLRDVEVGDRIELAMPGQQLVYTVDDLRIVEPSDMSVLQTRPRPSLTLVTCYPFYFVGSAPKRYIVQASLTNSQAVSSGFDPGISIMHNKEKTQ